MSNLSTIIDMVHEELLKTGGIERERALRHMHIYFVRGLWRWFISTPDEEWMAHAHMKMALLMLRQAQEA